MINSIDDVIKKLTQIVELAQLNKSRFGYFGSLYLEMTKTVKNNIVNGHFDDGERMEKLCVVFAKRYLDGFDNWQAHKPIMQSWQIALDETKRNNITVMQHLLCGINAHINLDLGIAAAQIAPGANINALKNDFAKINDVIKSLVNKVQDKLSKICWPMKLIDKIGKDKDEQLANFSIYIAREAAWKVATDLSSLKPEEHSKYIANIDNKTAFLAKKIINPGVMANVILKPIKWFEPSDTGKIIQILKS